MDYTAFDLVMEVAVEQVAPTYPDNYVVLNSGVVLEITGISAETYNAIIRKFQDREPSIPVVELKSKGRSEPNPNDPAYINAYKRWQGEQASALTLAVYALGTRVVLVPEHVNGPDHESTIDQLTLSGLLQSNTERGRLVAWLQHIALSRNARQAAGEINAILFAAGRAMGVTEQDVSEAVKRPIGVS